MMTISPTQNKHSAGWWSSYGMPYLTSPISTSAATAPFFSGFIAKSALTTPKMTCKEMLKEGLKTVLALDSIVDTQMSVHHLAEKAFFKISERNDQSNFRSMLASSMIVGAITAPALAVFNGQTMGCSIMESLKTLSHKQTGAIISRETSFLFSLKIIDPLCNTIKRRKAHPALEYSSVFISGAISSLVGHPADTALTFWQQGRKITNLRQLMQGSPIKALAVGGFSVVYKLIKDSIESLSN